jgi:hypothetical protein
VKSSALRRRVVESAIAEIKAHADEAGFTVGYERIREGKALTKIRFTVEKTDGREARETMLGRMAKIRERSARPGFADRDNSPITMRSIGSPQVAWKRPYGVIGPNWPPWRSPCVRGGERPSPNSKYLSAM